MTATAFVLVLVLTFGPGGAERTVIDYGMTEADCLAALADAPEPYERAGVTIAYRCEED